MKMDEKLSAIEAVGIFKGFVPPKWWNVHSISAHNKSYKTEIHTKSVPCASKGNNVIKPQENNINLMINQSTKEWNDSKSQKLIKKKEKEAEKDISIKSFTEMEIIKSETDIPENNNTVMNAYCDNKVFDSKGKTETSRLNTVIIMTKQAIIKKDNSLDEDSEEKESNKSEKDNHKINEKKIPSTVQEWVNHLPSKDAINSKEDANCGEQKDDSQGAIVGEGNSLVRAQLSREASLQSSSSLDSILDSRRPDPVEIFLNLGFGGLPGIDTENCRIPKRFLVPSKCKGGDWNEFLKRELIQAQNFECSSLGFRGLSGPSYRRPSAIVANIMEKLREGAVPQPHSRSRFSTVAKMILNEKSVLNKLTPEFQSVLSPDNRKFLQNQGKKSPEVPRRRIIFGQKSFAFAHDGEFVEVESSNVEEKTTKDSPTALTPKDVSEETKVYPSPDILLKLRRSSLQKQKKIEEDADVDDVFYVVGNEEHSKESPVNNCNSSSNNDCSKKTGKIPRRFLSSTNLKALEENNLSEAMRLEVEKEIMHLSQKIKSISNQDLATVLQQVKELRSKIENSGQDPVEM